MNSELQLAVEMTKLSDTMQGLREAIQRQENQLKTYQENGFQDIQLIPNRGFSEERQLSEDKMACAAGAHLHATESEMSQASHWSGSLELIHSSVTELENTLKSQDKQAIRVMAENEELRNEVKKKEKELKKQKILLKAERESFEQYKKEFCSDVKKQKTGEYLDVTEQNDKSSKEIKKLNSELAHYKQLYMEQSHTVNRLTKDVSNLKSDNIHLKGKLLQQDRRFNKLILEMAQRFKKSKDEMDLYASKVFETLSPQKVNVALYRTAARNARLAYDNSMLKREVESIKQQLTEKVSEEKTLRYLNVNERYSSNLSNKFSGIKLNASKNSASELIKPSQNQNKTFIKTTVSSTLQNNRENGSESWKKVVNKRSCSKMSAENWDCLTVDGSERLMRTYSAPELVVPGSSSLSK